MVDVLVCVDVGDLERGIDFYTRGLGLSLRRRHGPEWVELGGAAVPIMLIGWAPGSQACPGATRDYTRHWTPIHLDLIVPDLPAAVARAEAAGARHEGDIEVRAWNSIA